MKLLMMLIPFFSQTAKHGRKFRTKSAFNDVFDANEQIPEGEENLLSNAVDELRSAEDGIFRNQSYRELLDSTSKEYGPGSLYWDAKQVLGRFLMATN